MYVLRQRGRGGRRLPFECKKPIPTPCSSRLLRTCRSCFLVEKWEEPVTNDPHFFLAFFSSTDLGHPHCRHQDVTADAKRIAADSTVGGGGGVKRHKTFHSDGSNIAGAARVPLARTYASRGKVVARSKEKIQYGDVSIAPVVVVLPLVLVVVLVLLPWCCCCCRGVAVEVTFATVSALSMPAFTTEGSESWFGALFNPPICEQSATWPAAWPLLSSLSVALSRSHSLSLSLLLLLSLGRLTSTWGAWSSWSRPARQEPSRTRWIVWRGLPWPESSPWR